jgi:acetyl-CoA acetyltransferase
MPETPIIIGVGDVKNRSTAVADAREPMTLMLEAIQTALQDAFSSSKSNLQSKIDSIDVVKTWTWPYPDLPGSLAEQLGVEKSVKWKRYSDHGGDKPGKLFDEAAKRIARGECNVAVVTGGEALASRAYLHRSHSLHIRQTNTPISVRLRSSQETSTARLDFPLPSRRQRLHAHGPRPRKQ